MKILLSLLATVFLTSPVVATTTFSVSSGSCNNGVSAGSVSSSCDGGSCTFGSKIDIDATIYFKNDFDTDSNLSYKFCPVVMGFEISSYCTDTQESANICENLTNKDGNSCGTKGSYQFSYSRDIPNSGEYESYIESVSYMLSGKVYAYLGDFSTCTYSVSTSSSGSSSTAFFVGMSAAGAATLVAGALFIKRRRVITSGDGEDKSTPFVEMTDASAKMTIV